jgi:hypothetical protein
MSTGLSRGKYHSEQRLRENRLVQGKYRSVAYIVDNSRAGREGRRRELKSWQVESGQLVGAANRCQDQLERDRGSGGVRVGFGCADPPESLQIRKLFPLSTNDISHNRPCDHQSESRRSLHIQIKQ